MKYIVSIIAAALLVFSLSGCTANAENEIAPTSQTPTTQSSNVEASATQASSIPVEAVDFDFTKMGKDEIREIFNDSILCPDNYRGKTFCINGEYSSISPEDLETSGDFCIISSIDDCTCCRSGWEFKLNGADQASGGSAFSDGSPITLQGTFDTYQKEGVSYEFSVLKDATIIEA